MDETPRSLVAPRPRGRQIMVIIEPYLALCCHRQPILSIKRIFPISRLESHGLWVSEVFPASLACVAKVRCNIMGPLIRKDERSQVESVSTRINLVSTWIAIRPGFDLDSTWIRRGFDLDSTLVRIDMLTTWFRPGFDLASTWIRAFLAKIRSHDTTSNEGVGDEAPACRHVAPWAKRPQWTRKGV